ncbi:alpha/beta hydrolase [Lamprobacter modestohalophilus]|uniref:alpha/beta fold hydrolase n=1 Tax=Lamprobacter modestohalophilus TaxID=1064514 RepID=UPI002ADEAA25|nr:alpha/beta hydrolase [Lamprobacter modestohalophilus]MEA1048685.1 alpha/beta hydrolase [Lamprobacter modestohalophilus]
MRTLLRILLSLLLLVVLLGLLTIAVGPFIVSPSPAPGVSDAELVAAPESRFIALPTGADEPHEFHFIARLDEQTPGPAFMLLHGFTFNLFTWSQLLDLFAQYGQVVAYDQLPYGLSAKPVPEITQQSSDIYSKAAALEQLFALADALELEQLILVGNSSGGTLALEAALAAPEHVAGLVLIAPWVYSKRPIMPDWLAGLPQMQRVSLGLARYLGRNSPLLDYSYADPTKIDEERRALTGAHRLMAGWDLAWGALLQRSLTDPVTIAERLGEIQQPVLVLTGDADQIVPVSDTQATADALPNATLVQLPGCGHLPQEECPDQVEAAISNWLETQRSSIGPTP